MKFQVSRFHFFMLVTYTFAQGSRNYGPPALIADMYLFIHSTNVLLLLLFHSANVYRAFAVIQGSSPVQSTSLTPSPPHSVPVIETDSHLKTPPTCLLADWGVLPQNFATFRFPSLCVLRETSLSCICSLSHYPLLCVEHILIMRPACLLSC